MAAWVARVVRAQGDDADWLSISGDQLWALPRSFLQVV
jgi:hypothetical protein